MPSSTSNSNARPVLDAVPLLDWRREWVVVLAGTTLLIGLLEILFRQAGFSPTAVDTPTLWSHFRGQAYPRDGRALILAGTSRTQTGVDPRVMAAAARGWMVLQLASGGSCGHATLHDLAADSRFRGVVICDTLGPSDMHPDRHSSQRTLVRTFRTKRFTFEPAGSRAGAALQERLVVLHPTLGLRSVVSSILSSRRLPEVPYVHTRSDRMSLANFQGRDVAAIRKIWVGMASKDQALSESVRRNWAREHHEFFAGTADQLAAHGARLVLLRMPRSDALESGSARDFPEDWWWKPLGQRTNLITIDARTEPLLERYTCPDYSHLDRRDVTDFTKDLLTVLRAHGVALAPP